MTYLVTSWEEDANAQILLNKELFATSRDNCFRFKAENGRVIRTEVTSLKSSHEEADSRMLFHAKSIAAQKKVVIRTADTDVLIIALCNFPKLHSGMQLWLEVGLYTQNTLRYIDINAMHQQLDNDLCKALPGYHSFTGCDYTASFSRKGKVNPLKNHAAGERSKSF